MQWRGKVRDSQYIDLMIQDYDKGENKKFEDVSVSTTIEQLEQMVSV